MKKLAEFFSFTEQNTDLQTEFEAGSLSFFAIFYVFIVNAMLFERIGVSFGEAYMALLLTFAAGNFIVAFFARRPLIVSHSVALNAYFIFIVILSEGVHYSEASGAALLASVAFAVLAFSRCSKVFFKAIPDNLKRALPAGLGLLLVIFGLKIGKIIGVSPFRFAMMGDFANYDTFLSVIGLITVLVLLVNKVRLALAVGMALVAVTAFCLGYINFPQNIFMFPQGMERTVMGFSFNNIDIHLVFSLVLLMTVLYETVSVVGVSEIETEDEKKCFQAISFSSLFSTFFGMIPTSCAAESLIALQERGKTGMVPFTAALWGLVFIFFAPLVKELAEIEAITAPLLVAAGLCILCKRNDDGLFFGKCYDDLSEMIPALFMVLFMALTFDISLGIGAGIILQVLLKVFSGKKDELSSGTYILAVIFCVYFANKVI